jgi:hypothetical protein
MLRTRRRGDAGVNQSAFVALLVAVILVIVTALTAWGPKVGGTIAQYFICQLAGATDCVEPVIDPGSEPGQHGPDDVVFDFDLGEDIDPAIWELIQQDHPINGPLSDFVQDNLDEFPRQTDPLDIGGDFLDWDADVIFGPDGISIVLPEDEVHADIWGWVIQVIAGITGTAAGYLAEALCVSSLGPEAILACGMIRGYVTTSVWILVAGLLGGGSITDPSLWAAALAGGIVAAAGGALWTKYLKGWVDNNAKQVLEKVANAIGRLADKVWSVGKSALQKTRDFIFDVSRDIGDAFYRAARAMGYEP